jgi:hypothetical protein
MSKSICIFAGSANPPLAHAIAEYLELRLGRAKVSRFSDGEVFAEIQENVRGVDVYIVQPTCAPVNDHLMELLVMADALKRASAGSIAAVMPYYGYARQDRKVAPRTPITAKLVADLITSAGVDRVVAVDLHSGQIQGFFNKPFDHLYAMPVFLEYLEEKFAGGEAPVFVSPDAGGVERTRAYAKRIGADLAIIDKRRERANVSEVMHIIGDVEGRGQRARRRRRALRDGRRDARRAQRPGGRAHQGLAARRGRRHRHRPAPPGRPLDGQVPGAIRRQPARRGDQENPQRRLRELAVRVVRSQFQHRPTRERRHHGNPDAAG